MLTTKLLSEVKHTKYAVAPCHVCEMLYLYNEYIISDNCFQCKVCGTKTPAEKMEFIEDPILAFWKPEIKKDIYRKYKESECPSCV